MVSYRAQSPTWCVLHGVSYIWCPVWCVLHGVVPSTISYMVCPTWCVLHGVSYMVCPIWCVLYMMSSLVRPTWCRTEHNLLHGVSYIWCDLHGVSYMVCPIYGVVYMVCPTWLRPFTCSLIRAPFCRGAQMHAHLPAGALALPEQTPRTRAPDHSEGWHSIGAMSSRNGFEKECYRVRV